MKNIPDYASLGHLVCYQSLFLGNATQAARRHIWELRSHQDFPQGLEVISNSPFKLSFVNAMGIVRYYSDLSELSDLHDCVLFMDHAEMFFDSRRMPTKQANEVIDRFRCASHFNLTIILTCREPRCIHKWIRDSFSTRIVCRSVMKRKYTYLYIDVYDHINQHAENPARYGPIAKLPLF
jgi:hypothetical protein